MKYIVIIIILVAGLLYFSDYGINSQVKSAASAHKYDQNLKNDSGMGQ